MAATSKIENERLKEEARIKAQLAAEAERKRLEEERKRLEEQRKREEAERKIIEEKRKREEAEKQLAQEALSKRCLPFNFAKIDSIFKCDKCDFKVDVKTYGKLKQGMNSIFTFDDQATFNKYVYAHYSSRINGFYIYKLTDRVQEEIKTKYNGKLPKIVIGKINTISYNKNKKIEGDFEDWLDVEVDLLHSSQC